MAKTIDARTLTAPIYFSGDAVTPIETSTGKNQSKAIRGLQEITDRNSTERVRAVTALVKLTGNARAIKNNEERNNGGR